MDISKRYSIELNKINNHIADLERGHIYELTKAPGTPSYTTLAKHLREDINSLLDLIENDRPGVMEKVAEATKNI
jgi:predicted transcriptional regulator